MRINFYVCDENLVIKELIRKGFEAERIERIRKVYPNYKPTVPKQRPKKKSRRFVDPLDLVDMVNGIKLGEVK